MNIGFTFLIGISIVTFADAFHYYVRFQMEAPANPSSTPNIYCFGRKLLLRDGTMILRIEEKDVDIRVLKPKETRISFDRLWKKVEPRRKIANGAIVWISVGPGSDINKWYRLDQSLINKDKTKAKQLRIDSPSLTSILQNDWQDFGNLDILAEYKDEKDLFQQNYYTTIRLPPTTRTMDFVVIGTLIQTNIINTTAESDCGLLQLKFQSQEKDIFDAIRNESILGDWIIFVSKLPESTPPKQDEPLLRLTVKSVVIDVEQRTINCEVLFRPIDVEVKIVLKNVVQGGAPPRTVFAFGSVRENLNVIHIKKPNPVAATEGWPWKLETWDDYFAHKSETTATLSFRYTKVGSADEKDEKTEDDKWVDLFSTGNVLANETDVVGFDTNKQEITKQVSFLDVKYFLLQTKTGQLP